MPRQKLGQSCLCLVCLSVQQAKAEKMCGSAGSRGAAMAAEGVSWSVCLWVKSANGCGLGLLISAAMA